MAGLKHANTKIAGQQLHAVADWNAEHVITGNVGNFIGVAVGGKLTTITNPTTAQLIELTDNSIVDDLHRHSQLVASDGAPDPALSVDADGEVEILSANLNLKDNNIDGVNTINGDSNNSLNIAGYGNSIENINSTIYFYTGTIADGNNSRMSINSDGKIKMGLGLAKYALHISDSDDSTQSTFFGTGIKIESNSLARLYFEDTSADLNKKLSAINSSEGLTRFVSYGDLGTPTLHNDILVMEHSTGHVGIGQVAPATSAQLEIASTTGALLIPRMTTAQRDALTAVNGMMIYNSSTNAFNFYENSGWVAGSALA